MRLPIRNTSRKPLTIFMEPMCDTFLVPVGGQAILRIADGDFDSIDVQDNDVCVYDNGCEATVEVVTVEDQRVDDALSLVRSWLHRFGATDERETLDRVVTEREAALGYFGARRQVFAAFHAGFAGEEPPGEDWADCYLTGRLAAVLNDGARLNRTFPEISGSAPLDTDRAREAFAKALG